MLSVVLTSAGSEKLPLVLSEYVVTKVVLSWLLRLRGTKRAPTAASPGNPASFTSSLEVRSEGNIFTIRKGLFEGRAVMDGLTEGELLSRMLGGSEGLGEGDSLSRKGLGRSLLLLLKLMEEVGDSLMGEVEPKEEEVGVNAVDLVGERVRLADWGGDGSWLMLVLWDELAPEVWLPLADWDGAWLVLILWDGFGLP